MKKKVLFYCSVIAILVISVLVFSFSYAFFANSKEYHGKLNIVAGDLKYKLESSELIDNKITVEAGKTISSTIKLTSLNDISSKYELYYSVDDKTGLDIGYINGTLDNVTGNIDKNETKKVIIYIKNNSTVNKEITFGVEGGLLNNDLVLTKGSSIPEYSYYVDTILNGTDPVLTDNLVPVIIADDGTVTKANIQEEWYSYEKKNWANAVVLKDSSVTYNNGATIPETNIESYFVWIPKYSYQLWDLGNYTELTSISSKEQTINIKFGTTDTKDSKTGECTTPKVAGETGNCKVGDYMTHPAFLAFDTNGFWVGKFETGYDGATTIEEAQVNSSDSSKIIIKSNVYSWRNLTVGNMFKASYDYLRTDESHMMKNTEWGAVAYLQHSKYGSQVSVRINNNSSYITGYAATVEPNLGYSSSSIDGNRYESTALATDGTYTVNYLNSLSSVASTTGNKSGVYDMSGGAWEYVMGYTTGATTVGGSSGITDLYSDFYSNSNWDKYYDEYSSTSYTNYANRILGDATGEMGPFGSEVDPDKNTRYKSSWYGDHARFVYSSIPWFARGGHWHDGSGSGVFAFGDGTGGAVSGIGFRVVLAP